MNKAFQRWRTRVKHDNEEQVDGKEEGDRKLEKKRTYGIKNWGKVRTIPRIHKLVHNAEKHCCSAELRGYGLLEAI
eukprot:6213741-Pleurochrysis_carterae.AAC.1